MPTNNQEKWIDKLTNLVEKEAYCLQGKDCYMNEIIDLVRQEIRQAKIETAEQVKLIAHSIAGKDADYLIDHAIDKFISNLKNNDNTTTNTTK
jgi:hypothetical protein